MVQLEGRGCSVQEPHVMTGETPHKPGPNVAEIFFVRVPYLITGTLLFIAMTINLANIIARHLFGSAIFWAEEVLIFIVVWSTFLAVASIVYRGDHLNMDLFYAGMKPPWKMMVNAAVAAMFIACSLIIIVQSYKVVTLYIRSGTVSIAAGVPMVIPHTAVLVGFALILIATLLRLRAYVSGKFN
jgi:TRAP-type C4-dicarboxylate transport system permease small subunit